MNRRVLLSGTARRFVLRETRYLRDRSPAAADNFVRYLREARRNLVRFSEIGAPSPLPLPGLRRLVVGDYVLEYEIKTDRIEILAIRHGRQQDTTTPYPEDDPR